MSRAKRTLLALAVAGLFVAGTASPAYAIVHPVTPIGDRAPWLRVAVRQVA